MAMRGEAKADIVERLRREVPHCDDPSDYGESDLLILKAAEEIERLRAVLRIIAENKNYTSDLLARAALEGKQ